jgi:hypothetical protein
MLQIFVALDELLSHVPSLVIPVYSMKPLGFYLFIIYVYIYHLCETSIC